ncbi:MAG: MATE family efflux transporter [Dehalococcoidia bacterium]|nr:MATE family efflux transporter [Dehalococcoidia bacterium]
MDKTTNTDLTNRHILSRLLGLSWPLTVSETLGMLVPTIDMVWIGKLGTEAIAGVGIAIFANAVVMSLVSGITTGLRATIARLAGRNEPEIANHMMKQTLVFTLGFTLIIAIAGAFSARSLLELLGLEATAVNEGTSYLRPMFLAMPVFSMRLVAETSMQASGDALTVMKITVLHRLLHAVLSPLLVFGWLSFPRLGVSGAAWAPIIGQSIALILALWILFTGRTKLHLTLNSLRIAPRDMWRVVKIGMPTAVTFVLNDLGSMVIAWIMIPFGTMAVAAHVISRRIEMVLFMPIAGLGLAAGILSGQYLGARRPDYVVKSGWLAAGLATAFMVSGSLIILVFAEPIVGIFNSEPGLVTMGGTFLRIATVSFSMIGFIIVFMQCLNGVGDTVPPMVIMGASMWLVTIPLVYFLPGFIDSTVFGVRWMLLSMPLLSATALTTYFHLGKWKSRNV